MKSSQICIVTIGRQFGLDAVSFRRLPAVRTCPPNDTHVANIHTIRWRNADKWKMIMMIACPHSSQQFTVGRPPSPLSTTHHPQPSHHLTPVTYLHMYPPSVTLYSDTQQAKLSPSPSPYSLGKLATRPSGLGQAVLTVLVFSFLTRSPELDLTMGF